MRRLLFAVLALVLSGVLALVLSGDLYAAKWQGFADKGGESVIKSLAGNTINAQRVCSGASLEVRLTGTSTKASIFSDAGLTIAKSNPFTLDIGGYGTYYVAAGSYDHVFTGCSATWTRSAVVVSDSTASPVIDVRQFGAKGDYRSIIDGVINSTTTFTSATAAFTSGDIGKLIAVANAGAANPTAAWFGNPRLTLYTTIAGVTNSTTITLAAPAQNSASGISAIFASDDGAKIQAAINSLYTSNGGPGYGTVLIPGYFMTSTSIEINTQFAHIRLCGVSWMQSVIDHVGATSNGAVHITGSTIDLGAGQLYANNGNYTEITDLSIRSGNGHGINMDACLNSRVRNVWVISASTNHALWRITRGGILEANNVRLGGGNLGAGSTALPPFNGINVDPAHYGIHATNDTDSLITELHFTNVQLHGSATSYGVLAQTTAGSLHAAFDIQFVNCQIKAQAASAAASYFLDGVEATLIDCYSEQAGGSIEMVRVKATNENADVTLIGCNGTSLGGLVIDRSGSAAKTVRVAIDAVSRFASISTTGTNSSLKVVGDYFFTPDFAAGNFTANGAQTWTVDAGDVGTYRLSVSGKRAVLSWSLTLTTVAGTPNTQLLIKIPFGFVAAGTYRSVQTYSEDAGTTKVIGGCFVTNGATNVALVKLAGNWTGTVNQTESYGQMEFEVQ